MRSPDLDYDVAAGWEVVSRLGAAGRDDVGSGWVPDRDAVGLDMHVVPLPAVTLVVELGDGPLFVDGATGRQQLDSLVAGLSPGRAHISGEQVDCVEVRVSPLAAYSLLGVSMADLDGAVIGLGDLWGHDAPRIRERPLTALRGVALSRRSGVRIAQVWSPRKSGSSAVQGSGVRFARFPVKSNAGTKSHGLRGQVQLVPGDSAL